MTCFQNIIKYRRNFIMMTKAVRIYGKNDLRLDDVQLPEVGPDDVRIRVVSDSL